jgi:hypothetical protein
VRKAKNRGLAGRPLPHLETWTPFEEVPLPPPELLAATGNPSRIFVNSLYQVQWHDAADSLLGPLVWLSIKRRDLAPVRDWRDMQRIKNELVGPEAEAAELYPAESRLVDMSNQYHFWALPGGRFPFGFQSRAVTEEALPGGAQRPWPPETRPADLMTDTLRRALEFPCEAGCFACQ